MSPLPALVLLLAASSAGAQARPVFTLVVENDMLVALDRYYTSGVHLSWLAPAGDLAARLPGERVQVHVGLGLQHLVFTAGDIRAEVPARSDRPYAGVLLASALAQVIHGDALDSLEISAGVRGPAAGGEHLQEGLHRLFRRLMPMGWNHQLENLAVAQLSFEHLQRFSGRWRQLDVELAPVVGFTVGNLATNAGAGLLVRVGEDLRADFPQPRIRPGVGGGRTFEPRATLRKWFLAGGGLRLVGRDATLDAPGIRLERVVADVQAGFGLQSGTWSLGLTLTRRTQEFTTQGQGHWFGSLAVMHLQ